MAAMKHDETIQTHAQLLKGHISPKDPKWLAENVEEVNHSFNQILKLIEQDDEFFTEKCDGYPERRTKLIAHVEGILHKHQFLAEQYDEIRRTLHNDKSSAFHIQNIGDSMVCFPKGSCFESPDPKSVIHKVDSEGSSPDSSQRSDDVSSEMSAQGVSDCSSLLFSDSDSESQKLSANKSSSSPFGAGRVLENNFVNTLKEIDIAELRGQINKYEEELRFSNKNLQFSEEQVAKLKKEFEEMAGSFKSQLESAKCDIQEREADLESERQKVLELQMQVSCLETQVTDSNDKIAILEMELELLKEKLISSEEEFTNAKSGLSDEISDYACQLKNQLESVQQEVALLETKLDSEKRRSSEMQDIIQQYQADMSEREDEIKKLNAALQGANEKLSAGEAQLQSCISTLSLNLALLEAKAAEWELRSKSLEKDIQQREADKTEMQRIHETQEIKWKNDFNHLKAELNEKDRLVDLLNQELDGFKLKYDELMAEKDGAVSRIQTLSAELDSRDNEIQQMQGNLRQLHLENVELILASETAHEQYKGLTLRVEELEKEVESQNVLISDRAEEKREAIRQLCFSLEHYRNIYEELRQAYSGNKQHFVTVA